MKRKTVLILSGLLCVLLVLAGLAWRWMAERSQNAAAIREAIANPRNIDTAKLLNDIDASFNGLGAAAKQKILDDPKMTNERVSEATRQELEKSFKILFQLPKPLRKRLIQESAEDIRRKVAANPERVDAFFDSPAGSGAMQGASRFFLLELSGREKAEASPITLAMYEVMKKQAERKPRK